jgi:hypothetical protein
MAGDVSGGIYRGTVLNSQDPSGAGRVQVLVPAVSGQTSGWAMPCEPMPKFQAGDTAWVMFEGGDAGRPVCVGRLPR